MLPLSPSLLAAALHAPPLAALSARRGVSRAHTPVAALDLDLERELLSVLDGGERGATITPTARAEIGRISKLLEEAGASDAASDTAISPNLPGRWRVLFQGDPEAAQVSPLDPGAWQRYLAGDGPSPVQNLVSDSSNVGRLYQILELSEQVDSDGAPTSGRFVNVVDFSEAPLPGLLAIEASLEGRPQRNRLAFRFRGGRLLLKAIWNGTLDLPYPVPFDLLGDNALGWLQTDYLSSTLRLSRGNKGSLFVLAPEPNPDATDLQAMLSASAAALTEDPAQPSRAPVVICPAQFGTATDYAELLSLLRERGHPAYVAPLKRLDWLRLLPAALTADYWKGKLRPEVALPFYFEALDSILDQVEAEHPGARVQLVAHSIGGWIARAYLGQATEARRRRCSALVTLGTPHASPPAGVLTTLDQTRGLLSNVNAAFPGAYHSHVRYLTVGSEAVAGGLRADLDSLLAYASYLPLSGDGEAKGDGITPAASSELEGAEHRLLDAFHIDFVPFVGVRLRGTPWYGSPALFPAWADFLL